MAERRPKRNYSDSERASALAFLAANGGNISRTAKETGIPKVTIHGWSKGTSNPVPVAIRTGKLEELADIFERVARMALGCINEVKLEKAGLQALVTSAAIATDKMRLLRDQSTSIDESRGTVDARVLLVTKVLNSNDHDAAIDRAIGSQDREESTPGGDGLPEPVHSVDADGQAG